MAREDVSRELALAIQDLIGLQHVVTVRATVDPASVAAEATGVTAVTATDALPGDVVLYGTETDDLLTVNAGIHVYVSDADEIAVNISNNTVAAGAAVDLASASWVFVVLRRAS